MAARVCCRFLSCFEPKLFPPEDYTRFPQVESSRRPRPLQGMRILAVLGQVLKGTLNALLAAIQDVGVDHGGGDIGVEMSGEGMSQGMAARRFDGEDVGVGVRVGRFSTGRSGWCFGTFCDSRERSEVPSPNVNDLTFRRRNVNVNVDADVDANGPPFRLPVTIVNGRPPSSGGPRANLPAFSSERAGVAELADAHGSGPCSLRRVWVRPPPPA